MASKMKLWDQKLEDNLGELLSREVQKSGGVIAYTGMEVDAVLAIDVVGVYEPLDLAIDSVLGH